MPLHVMLRHRPAREVLAAIRQLAALPPPVDPWPTAWPYASPMHTPTVHLPLIGALS